MSREIPTGNKLFQINENDLAELERIIPALCDRHMKALDSNVDRTAIRVIQRILSDVRWNYGPPTDVTEMPA